MAFRKRINKRKSRKMFRRGATKSNRRNAPHKSMRGGYRL